MKKLTEADIIEVLREEWAAKIKTLTEEVELAFDVDFDKDKEKEEILTANLKVVHSKSGIRYTIGSIGPRDVILLTPEGEQFIIDREELEQEYELS